MIVPSPIIQQVNDREYKLIFPLDMCLDKYGSYIVKPPFIFDGASIPRIFWTLVGSPFTGSYARAAFVHDILYLTELFDRKTCDWIFLELMQEYGCGWFKRNIIWSAVKSFGWYVWNSHDQKQVQFYRKNITKI
jgi:hypothetical protein